MPGVKTNERPGTRAVLRHYRMSAYKAREILDVVRGRDVDKADEILRTIPREAARVVAKVLSSAVSNARNNDGLDPDELYISACYADEGTTLKRWRPRARGRATRIRKRTCHITVIVSRLPDDRLEHRRARQEAAAADLRSRRVAASRRESGRRGAAGARAGSGRADRDESADADELDENDVDAVDTDFIETDEAVDTEDGIETEDGVETDEVETDEVDDEEVDDEEVDDEEVDDDADADALSEADEDDATDAPEEKD